jgi:uncharacterized membrane protein
MTRRRRVQLAAIIVILVAYAGLSHYANSAAKNHDLAVAVTLIPVLAVGLTFLWRWTSAWFALPATAAVALALHLCWPMLAGNFPVIYLLQEVGLYGVLALSFGRTLFGQRVALCTQLADRVHGPLSPLEVRYTRRVTGAWTLFFASIAAATLALYAFAPLRIWSLFANFCVIPLVGLMFAAEYAVRHRVLPHGPRQGILAAVRVYFADST